MMKKMFVISLFLSSILMYSCYRPSSKQAFEDLKVLEGTWATYEGTKFSESWKIINDSLMHGIGFSLNGTDTAFKEQLQIKRIGDSLFYGALVKENDGYVFFKLEEAGRNKWVFKNPVHDYPNIIDYKIKDKEVLEATTSNIRGNKKIAFKLRKVSK